MSPLLLLGFLFVPITADPLVSSSRMIPSAPSSTASPKTKLHAPLSRRTGTRFKSKSAKQSNIVRPFQNDRVSLTQSAGGNISHHLKEDPTSNLTIASPTSIQAAEFNTTSEPLPSRQSTEKSMTSADNNTARLLEKSIIAESLTADLQAPTNTTGKAGAGGGKRQAGDDDEEGFVKIEDSSETETDKGEETKLSMSFDEATVTEAPKEDDNKLSMSFDEAVVNETGGGNDVSSTPQATVTPDATTMKPEVSEENSLIVTFDEDHPEGINGTNDAKSSSEESVDKPPKYKLGPPWENYKVVGKPSEDDAQIKPVELSFVVATKLCFAIGKAYKKDELPDRYYMWAPINQYVPLTHKAFPLRPPVFSRECLKFVHRPCRGKLRAPLVKPCSYWAPMPIRRPECGHNPKPREILVNYRLPHHVPGKCPCVWPCTKRFDPIQQCLVPNFGTFPAYDLIDERGEPKFGGQIQIQINYALQLCRTLRLAITQPHPIPIGWLPFRIGAVWTPRGKSRQKRNSRVSRRRKGGSKKSRGKRALVKREEAEDLVHNNFGFDHDQDIDVKGGPEEDSGSGENATEVGTAVSFDQDQDIELKGGADVDDDSGESNSSTTTTNEEPVGTSFNFDHYEDVEIKGDQDKESDEESNSPTGDDDSLSTSFTFDHDQDIDVSGDADPDSYSRSEEDGPIGTSITFDQDRDIEVTGDQDHSDSDDEPDMLSNLILPFDPDGSGERTMTTTKPKPPPFVTHHCEVWKYRACPHWKKAVFSSDSMEKELNNDKKKRQVKGRSLDHMEFDDYQGDVKADVKGKLEDGTVEDFPTGFTLQEGEGRRKCGEWYPVQSHSCAVEYLVDENGEIIPRAGTKPVKARRKRDASLRKKEVKVVPKHKSRGLVPVRKAVNKTVKVKGPTTKKRQIKLEKAKKRQVKSKNTKKKPVIRSHKRKNVTLKKAKGKGVRMTQMRKGGGKMTKYRVALKRKNDTNKKMSWMIRHKIHRRGGEDDKDVNEGLSTSFDHDADIEVKGSNKDDDDDDGDNDNEGVFGSPLAMSFDPDVTVVETNTNTDDDDDKPPEKVQEPLKTSYKPEVQIEESLTTSFDPDTPTVETKDDNDEDDNKPATEKGEPQKTSNKPDGEVEESLMTSFDPDAPTVETKDDNDEDDVKPATEKGEPQKTSLKPDVNVEESLITSFDPDAPAVETKDDNDEDDDAPGKKGEPPKTSYKPDVEVEESLITSFDPDAPAVETKDDNDEDDDAPGKKEPSKTSYKPEVEVEESLITTFDPHAATGVDDQEDDFDDHIGDDVIPLIQSFNPDEDIGMLNWTKPHKPINTSGDGHQVNFARPDPGCRCDWPCMPFYDEFNRCYDPNGNLVVDSNGKPLVNTRSFRRLQTDPVACVNFVDTDEIYCRVKPKLKRKRKVSNLQR